MDAGKTTAVALVADFTGERLCRPFQFRLNRSGIAELVARVESATEDRPARLVRVGVEASGYHLPLVAPGVLPAAWEAVEFNPAHVTEQRKTNGKRGVKTDASDALDEPTRRIVKDRLLALDDGDAVLHGNSHPGNVIVSVDRPVVIDWLDASRGRAEAGRVDHRSLQDRTGPQPGQ